ncbi:MAG: flagellar hook-associated protein 3 [Lachnospiraceae bacterium]|nr:flagellar hook-associated protein 3 [Lachnospiraceae bacterium]
MRITNNVIMRNTKTNINGNKINVNEKNNQMSSQKKIDRPSDDPVIAVRALRLRSNLSELKQYLKTNIEEAESWMNITDTALYNMRGIMNDMHTLCDHAANDTLNQDDRNQILAQLRQNQEQIFAEGNADYAGRTVFTGWKTDTTLTFSMDKANEHYTITQPLSYADLEEEAYNYNTVSNEDIMNFRTKAATISQLTEQPASATLNRIRLAYDNLSLAADTTTDPTGQTPITTLEIKYAQADGTAGSLSPIAYTTTTTAAMEAAGYTIGANDCVFNTDTGELYFGETLSDTLKQEQAQFTFTYDKTGFEKGDLTPENYFNCTNWSKGDASDWDRYTYTHYEGGTWDGTTYTTPEWIHEDINYTVATNQEMAINLEAKDVLDQNLDRDISALADIVQASIDAHNKLDRLTAMQKQDAYSSPEDQTRLAAMIEAVSKEVDYADDKMRDVFTHYVGKMQGYLTTMDLARTDLGSLGQRLDLTKNRVESQYTTVDKLKAENEDEDLSDIVIDYQAAYLAYQASLQAAAKVQQQTLLDYI